MVATLKVAKSTCPVPLNPAVAIERDKNREIEVASKDHGLSYKETVPVVDFPSFMRESSTDALRDSSDDESSDTSESSSGGGVRKNQRKETL